MNESYARHAPLALAVAVAFGTGSAQAATISVTHGGDTGTSSSCTLRQAIESANDDASGSSTCSAGAGADIIEFDPLLANSTINLAGTALTVATSTSLVINGSDQVIDAMGLSRVIFIDENANVTASNLTLTGGSAGGGGGGGVHLRPNAKLYLSNSTISDNSSEGFGGGLYAWGYNTVSVTNSTISGNVAQNDGGGIYVLYTTLSVTNSTISGNTATGDGGAIYLMSDNTITIVDSTISGNTASLGSGGGIFAYTAEGHSAVIEFKNTILSANTAVADPDLHSGSLANSITTVYSLLGTALQASYTGNGNVFSDAPGLAVLASNGGPTKTMLPESGSPGIDAGNNNLIPVGVTTDQRGTGFARVGNGTVDIGAVESNGDIIFANGFDDSGAL